MSGFFLEINGVGNAWPVLLEDDHPFYDRHKREDLVNASFSITEKDESGAVRMEILVDAGHGVVQQLLNSRNRIPDMLVITHPHLDHTASLDWIARSYYEKHQKQAKFPVCCSAPCFDFIMRSFPHLEKTVRHIELVPGRHLTVPGNPRLTITGYPLYHGESAEGAMMVLFEPEKARRVLITGDILFPLLREIDRFALQGVDFLITDANNRFPFPRSNHWSFISNGKSPAGMRDHLNEFTENLHVENVLAPHLSATGNDESLQFFEDIRQSFGHEDICFSVLDFARIILPGRILCVHYSGGEDRKIL